jgi:hypothetical protein
MDRCEAGQEGGWCEGCRSRLSPSGRGVEQPLRGPPGSDDRLQTASDKKYRGGRAVLRPSGWDTAAEGL